MASRAAVPQLRLPSLPNLATPGHRLTPAANFHGLGGAPEAALCCPLRLKTLVSHGRCKARRRMIRYDEEEEEEEEEEEYGQNAEIELMEAYSEAVRTVALLVRATVDGQEELVLIFKGFSSCLSSGTLSDPSKSVLPARAVIRSIDVVKGPFDPSNIEYLEKDLTWEAFKVRLQSKAI